MATESSEHSLFIDGAVVDGAYRVVGELASGGMGVVYEVEQLTTGARRALKAMNLHMSRDAKLRARFVQEARVGAVIKSDHVASILDAGVDDASGIPYLVMELLEGRTLSRELRHRGAFTWPEVAEIMRQICHALGAAHAAGVVHRDLKPANVFLAASRTAGMPYVIKLLDFGIAKVVADAQDGATAIIQDPRVDGAGADRDRRDGRAACRRVGARPPRVHAPRRTPLLAEREPQVGGYGDGHARSRPRRDRPGLDARHQLRSGRAPADGVRRVVRAVCRPRPVATFRRRRHRARGVRGSHATAHRPRVGPVARAHDGAVHSAAVDRRDR